MKHFEPTAKEIAYTNHLPIVSVVANIVPLKEDKSEHRVQCTKINI